MNAGADPNGEPKTAPLHVAPPSAQPAAGGAAPDHSVAPPAIGATQADACPTCGAQMAIDQRYCLNCGHRRGEPRLPFMDAVVFMGAMNQPPAKAQAAAAPPPPPRKAGLTPGTTLIAGIATLILAVGVGVLIGRSGDDGTAPAANAKPTVIQVGGNTGGGEGEATATADTGKEAKATSSKKSGGGKAKKAPEEDVGASGTSKAAEEVLKPKVPQAKPTAKVGETCDQGTAGCGKSGKFDGSFFE